MCGIYFSSLKEEEKKEKKKGNLARKFSFFHSDAANGPVGRRRRLPLRACEWSRVGGSRTDL